MDNIMLLEMILNTINAIEREKVEASCLIDEKELPRINGYVEGFVRARQVVEDFIFACKRYEDKEFDEEEVKHKRALEIEKAKRGADND